MSKKLLAAMLAVLMLLLNLTPITFAAENDVDFPMINIKDTTKNSQQYKAQSSVWFDVYDLRGKTDAVQKFDYTVPDHGATLLLFISADHCGNSEALLQEIANSELFPRQNLNVIGIECTGADKTKVQELINKSGADEKFNEIYYRPSNDVGQSAFALGMWYTLLIKNNGDTSKITGFNGSLGMAYAVLITKQRDGNYISYAQENISSIELLQNFIATIDSSVDTTKTVNVTVPGQQRYDCVADVLKSTNQVRRENGAEVLQLDAELTKLAMQRAAECALMYSHTRPNGFNCFTIGTDSDLLIGENIAAGQTTSAEVVDDWEHSPGHFANMVNSDAKQMGIGVFENNGIIYWVQLFSTKSANTPVKNITSLAADVTVSTLTSHINPCVAKDIITIEQGMETELPLLQNEGTILLPTVEDVIDADEPDRIIAKVEKRSTGDGVLTLTNTVAGSGVAVLKAYESETEPQTVAIKISEKPGEPATPVTRISLSKTALKLNQGETATLTATVKPDHATDKTVTWTSSNDNIVTVDKQGTVTAVGAGEATIIAKAGEKQATCRVTVIGPTITLNNSSLQLVVGGKDAELIAEVTGKLADTTITWASSDENVVTCASGKIHAVGEGEATVAATLAADTTVKAECTVTVAGNPAGKPVLEVTIDADGGKFDGATSIQVLKDSEYKTPVPSKSGYKFVSWEIWLADSEIGSFVKSDQTVDGDTALVVTEDTKLVAVWRSRNSSGNRPADNTGSNIPVEPAQPDQPTEPAESVDSVQFIDVTRDDYYFEAVQWAVDKNITSGTSATTFGPNDGCTRAQVVTFLWNAAGSPNVSGNTPFTDVNPDDWYSQAVHWAVERGITSGTSATTFSPDRICTRGQIMTFLYKADGSPATSGSNFADVTDHMYYADAVKWAVSKDITSGTSDTTFSPDMVCTRAQIVTFLYRFMEK